MTATITDGLEQLDFEPDTPCERSNNFFEKYRFCEPRNSAYVLAFYRLTCGCRKIRALCQLCMNKFIENKFSLIHCSECDAHQQYFESLRFEVL